MKVVRLICLSLTILLLSACSTTKYVPEGDFLLSSVKVTNTERNRDVNTSQL